MLETITAEEKNILDALMSSIEEQEIEASGVGNDADSESYVPVTLDKSTAELYLKFYKRIQGEIEAVNEHCDKYIKDTTERINNSRKEQLNKLNKRAEYFYNQLMFYAQHNPPVSGKTIDMIEGKLAFRSAKEKIEHDDKTIISSFFDGKKEDARFFDEGPKKFSWTKFKEALKFDNGQATIDGKIVEGVTVSPAHENFIIS